MAAALCGAIVASTVEVGVVVMTVGRTGGVRRLQWGAAFVAVAAVAVVLTIPLDIVRIERGNRYFKNLALRHPAT